MRPECVSISVRPRSPEAVAEPEKVSSLRLPPIASAVTVPECVSILAFPCTPDTSMVDA